MNWCLYIIIGICLSFVTITKFILEDRDTLYWSVIIMDICEGLIVGIAWEISVPILALGNIIIALGTILEELYGRRN